GDDQGNPLLEDDLYRSRDFVLVDESHNFRHPGTQRYRVLEEYLGDGKRCCFLTATPRNKSAWDVYHQLKLFHQNERTDIPINPPVLHEYFKGIDRGTHRLHDLLANVLIRRTRRDILKWFGYDAETDERLDPARIDEYSAGKRRAYVRVADRRQFFPRRNLETIEYSIDEAYQGLYHKIRESLGGGGTDGGGTDRCLKYVRYGLWHYVKPSMKNDDRYAGLARSGISLRGLMRVLLFKRFESSVHAFRQTVTRLVQSHERFLLALSQGFVAAGEDAQQFLNDSGDGEERDLMESLRAVSGRFLVSDFDEQRLTDDVEHDISVLQEILRVVNPITPEADAKLQTLLSRLCSDEFQEGKCLIFTQYADTAKYLCENLISFTRREDIEAVCSGDSNRMQTIGRFAPVANPEARRRTKFSELNILVATDALSEGLNLQDANRIINYDLHWNPVRLIQRFGRIDRIGSVHDAVHGFNFLPETGIEEQLGLRETLENRIREIHESIGEDAAILDPGEQLNEKAMYSIYDNRGEGLESLEEEDDATGVDLNEATEMFREMK
ncbi:MAG: DEAD/DEAH box helicase, partial [Planctomycetaceae bacterium]|nr:DEAD/DEAH box helicase [Planctomycetaceae bacterium]